MMALLHLRSGTEEARRRDGTYTDVLAKNLRLRYSNYHALLESWQRPFFIHSSLVV